MGSRANCIAGWSAATSVFPERIRGTPMIDDPLQLDARSALLLDPAAALGARKQACDGLHADCLARLPSLSTDATALASGMALSPADAARCTLDFLRTARLLQAAERTIRTRLQQFPGRAVEVLYAGCGPLAPLMLVLARRYRRQPVRVTLVDIHPAALAAAEQLFAMSGVAACLRPSVRADAATLRLPEGFKPDFLLVEVMQRALASEPQLAVLANLWPQCAVDAALVPARVAVHACLGRMDRELRADVAPQRHELGCLIELSAATLPALATSMAGGVDALPERALQVPLTADAGMQLMLRTEVEAADGLRLADYDSGLTYPHWEHALGRVTPGEWLGFRYRLRPTPGFEVRRLRDDATGLGV